MGNLGQLGRPCGGRLADELDLRHSLAETQRRLDRVGEPAGDAVLADEAVDHDLDPVLFVATELQVCATGQLVRNAVDAHPRVALARHLVEEGLVLPLAAAHERGQDGKARAIGQVEHAVDDLLRALPADRLAAVRAVRLADAGIEEPQVVVDLGDGSHRRAGIARGRLLIDRYRRREPLDEIDVGLVHLPEELPCVRRERLHVAALALGVDRVESKR